MPIDAAAKHILDMLPEPALLVGTDSRIFLANPAARARLGAGAGDVLTEFCPADPAAAELRAYLRRCSGARSPLPGAIALRGAGGETLPFHASAGLLAPSRDGDPAILLLRLTDRSDARFAALAQHVSDLNDEIRRRRRIQALLERALEDREVLMRELHHRVKNNIQMLAAMLYAARREAVGGAGVPALEEASRRLAAVGMVHQLLYTGDSLRGVRADLFVARIASAVMEAAGGEDRFSSTGDASEIPNDTAVPLALVLNELLANAVKHGNRPDGTPGHVRVGLTEVDGALELVVADEGPGFEIVGALGRRATGLGLVQGLARQIGGTFSVERPAVGGARCIVRFRTRTDAAIGKDKP